MPGSSLKGKVTVANWFNQIKPKQILDVGPGWGTYYHLLSKRDQTWDAVEIHKPYIGRFKLEKYYQRIYNVDIVTFKSEKKYDLVFCGDVLEHIENKDAVSTLQKLSESSTWLIVSLPIDGETGADPNNDSDTWENPHEQHKGNWKNFQFMQTLYELGIEVISMVKFNDIAIYLLSKQPLSISEPLTNPIEWSRYMFGTRYISAPRGFKNRMNTLFSKYSYRSIIGSIKSKLT